MMSKEKKWYQYEGTLPVLEELAYYGLVILTFGIAWAVKIIIKKAIIEGIKEANV